MNAISKTEQDATASELAQDITGILRPYGYKRKGSTWRHPTLDAVLVVNLQRSNWGGGVYINLGVLLKSIEDRAEPLEQNCHLRARLERLCPEPLSGKIHELSCGGYEALRAGAQKAELLRALQDFALPALDSLATLDGQKHLLRRLEAGSITVDGWVVMAAARAILQV